MADVSVVRVGDRWVFSDGAVLPVVSGGADEFGDGAAFDAAGAAAASAAVDTPDTLEETSTPPAVPGDDTPSDTPDDAEVDVDGLDLGDEPDEPAADGKVEDLPDWAQRIIRDTREEAATNRVRAKEYHEAFDGYTDDDRGSIISLVAAIRDDPAAAAAWMEEQAAHLRGATPDTPAGSADDRPLTKADLDSYFAQREQQETARREAEQRNSDVAAITSHAETLGYKPDTLEYVELTYLAAKQPEGDLKARLDAAHAQLEKRNQKIVREFVQKRRQDADATPTTPPQAGGRQAPKPITSFEEAAAAARAKAGF